MVKIYTFPHRRPDFITLQAGSFRRHMQEDFEIVAVNNAAFDLDRGNYSEINRQCASAGVAVVDVQRDAALARLGRALEGGAAVFSKDGTYSNANIACAYPLCWAWKSLISKEGTPACLVHSDVFMVQPARLSERLQGNQVCGIWQTAYLSPEARGLHGGRGMRYLWEALALLDMPRLPDAGAMSWWCGRLFPDRPGMLGVPVDCGGQTYHYLKAHPEVSVESIGVRHFPDDDSCPAHPADYHEFSLGEAKFLHYRSGSNWNNRPDEYHRLKTEWLKRRLEV